MSDLVEFAKRIEARLAASNSEPEWKPGEAERYMSEVSLRRQRYEQLAVRLIDSVIQPRVEIFAGYFPNADLSKGEPTGHCACWFGYCERFPVSTKVVFAVEHDTRFQKIEVCYEASMTPVYIKMHEAAKLEVSLEDARDDVVAAWVEDRLLDFADTYLLIDRGKDDFEDEPTTDPVCGMRISRSNAVASDSHRGHPYFFCSHDCHERFARDPRAYVAVKETS